MPFYFRDYFVDPRMHASWQGQQDGHFRIKDNLGHVVAAPITSAWARNRQLWFESALTLLSKLSRAEGREQQGCRPYLAWGRPCSVRRPQVWSSQGLAMPQFLQSPPHRFQNIPTTALAPAPPELHSSVKIQFCLFFKVDVSPLSPSPRKLKPGPSCLALRKGHRSSPPSPPELWQSDDGSYIHTGRGGVQGQSHMRWGGGPRGKWPWHGPP